MNWLVSGLALAALFHLFFYLNPFALIEPNNFSDLSGDWKICLAADSKNCRWNSKILPSDLTAEERQRFDGWLHVKKTFSTPQACSQRELCYLLMGEVGDAVEIALNGVTIGQNGAFPPNVLYAKHYPISVALPRSLFFSEKPNTLHLRIYSMKKAQAGLRRGPIAITSRQTAFRFVQSRVTQLLVLPTVGGTILLLMGVMSWFVFRHSKILALDRFALYCLASGFFLISFSEIPREYLPIAFSGYLHFTLRLLSDWALWELVRGYFSDERRWLIGIRVGYVLFILALFIEHGLHLFGMTGIGSTPFDGYYGITRSAFPFLLIPLVQGLCLSIRSQNRGDRIGLGILFSLVLPMQVSDILVFHGFLRISYWVKIYPVAIALIFGWRFLVRFLGLSREWVREGERAKHNELLYQAALEISHDLLTPLSGIKLACEGLRRNADNPVLIASVANALPRQVQRTEALLRSLLSFAKGADPKKAMAPLDDLIHNAISAALDGFPEHEFVVKGDLSNTFLSADSSSLSRAFQNVIKNAAEVSRVVRLELTRLVSSPLDWATLDVIDEGPGIASGSKDRIFEPFFSLDKSQGIGLGLAFSRRIIELHGGTIRLMDTSCSGTWIRIQLPVLQNFVQRS